VERERDLMMERRMSGDCGWSISEERQLKAAVSASATSIDGELCVTKLRRQFWG
jgi:hypothetical protein